MTAMYSWKTNNWRIFMEQTLLCCYKTKCTGARDNIANLVNEKTMMFKTLTQQTTQMLLKVCLKFVKMLTPMKILEHQLRTAICVVATRLNQQTLWKKQTTQPFKTAKPHIRIKKNSAQTAVTRHRITVKPLRPLDSCNLRNRFNRL